MEREASCITTKAILDYVKQHNQGDYSGLLDNLDPEIDVLPDPENFLRDPNNWISCAVVSKLFEKARGILDDETAAYKIAKEAVEKTSMGYAQSIIVKAFWSTKKALKQAQRINDKYNRSKRIELVELKRNESIVRFHWKPHMGVSKDICLMNQGTFAFMPLVWGGEPLAMKEECCYFDGNPYCEFHLKWPVKNRFHEIFSRFFTSKSVLLETITEMEKDKETLEKKYEEVNRLNVEMNQKVKELLAIQETGKAILSVLDLKKLLTVIMNHLFNICRINRAVIMLANKEAGYLEYLHGMNADGDIPKEVQEYKVSLDRVSNILVRVSNTGKSEYVPDVKSSNLRKDNTLLVYGNPHSVYVIPLITKSMVTGVIATDGIEGAGVPVETRKILEIFTPQIAIAIENARLYNKLHEQMKELKRSHSLLSRAEKLTFLGNLAARLAHEIKNPMTAIGTFIQMLPNKYDDVEFREEFHKIAMEETTRVNNLITELLDLAKPKEPHFEFGDLNELIERMILLISPQSNAKHIQIFRKFDSNIGPIRMDAEKIKQVILNLISNAVEFSPERGTIEISTTKHGKNANQEKMIHNNG